jgi:hypothetical protein
MGVLIREGEKVLFLDLIVSPPAMARGCVVPAAHLRERNEHKRHAPGGLSYL